MQLFLVSLLTIVVGSSSFGVPSTLLSLRQRKVSAAPHGRLASGSSLNAAADDPVEYVIATMLKGSTFVYTYAMLRNIVNQHDNLIRDKIPAYETKFFFIKTALPLVDFYRPELIVTQRGAQSDNPNRYLMYPITAVAILEFIANNRQFLDDNKGESDVKFVAAGDGDNTNLKMEADLREMSKFDGELLDYDDQETSHEGLCYGITINRSNKRISVIFRGTVGGKDIVTDANFFTSTPEIFTNSKEDIKMHAGFASYLFEDFEDGPIKKRSKFDRLVTALKEIYDELPVSKEEKEEYKLFISGHSLGGALCNLFAFGLAETQQGHPLFNRVTAVSFASPVVGTKGYNKAFQVLEKKGILRHIRVSNDGDLVPTKPFPGYTQNGVNVHLYDEKKDVLKYRNTKRTNLLLIPKALENHMLPMYESRLEKQPKNKEILESTLEGLYTTAAGDFRA